MGTLETYTASWTDGEGKNQGMNTVKHTTPDPGQTLVISRRVL